MTNNKPFEPIPFFLRQHHPVDWRVELLEVPEEDRVTKGANTTLKNKIYK
jgi:hypothetical protein